MGRESGALWGRESTAGEHPALARKSVGSWFRQSKTAGMRKSVVSKSHYELAVGRTNRKPLGLGIG